MALYSDVDLSLELNIYNDISKITDRQSILNTFKNNILINYSERPFNNNTRPSLGSLLNKTFSLVDEEILYEIIEDAANKDDRIISVLNISPNFDVNNYTLKISISLEIDISADDINNIIDFDLIVKRT